MNRLSIKTTERKQVVDITNLINENLPSGEGVCNIFLTHTSAALTTADLDPGTDLDMLDAFEAMVPDLKYRHPHDPSHVGDHIMTSLIGNSVTIPYANRELMLGQWQRVVVIEFNGPKEREVVLSC